MKKTLFLLVALVVSMSINAQNAKIMKILDGETVLDTYDAKTTLKVVFDEVPQTPTTGTATRKGTFLPIVVKWIQLWKDGPKFAEYNVGAASHKAEDYGGYYAWGGHQDKVDDHYTGSSVLTGDNDTATKLWGNNWRMPTKDELQALLDNCDGEWTTVGDVYGYKFTGKEYPYKTNSIFLPAAGIYDPEYNLNFNNGDCDYWSSEAIDLGREPRFLYLRGDYYKRVDLGSSEQCYSVRAVLVENIK